MGFDVVSIEAALRRFAALGADSNQTDVNSSVAEIVSALKSGAGATTDLLAARREIAALLEYLHGLRHSRHPGRVKLARALADEVLPLLYISTATEAEEDDDALDDGYEFAEAERAVLNRAADMMAAHVQFLRAETNENPRHGTPGRDDGVPPLFMFSPAFRQGFYRILAYAFRTYMRTKMTVTRLYRPVAETLASGDETSIARHDKEIRALVRSALSWAQMALNHPPLDAADAKRAKTRSASLEDQEAERLAAVEALEKARLHGTSNDYFLPQVVDYDMLTLLFDINHKVLASGIAELGFAVTQGEDESYVTRQVERLNNTHDLVHFDLAVLAAFLFGREDARITFKQIHDTCIGAAKSREVMLRVRPLLMAELCRRPQQMGWLIVRDCPNPAVSEELFGDRLETLARWLRCLNIRRFEPEILGCTGEMQEAEALTPFFNWVMTDDRNIDKLEGMLAEVRARRSAALKV